jgi:hypothetical protein
MKNIATGKHSGSLPRRVSDEDKKFYDMDTRFPILFIPFILKSRPVEIFERIKIKGMLVDR